MHDGTKSPEPLEELWTHGGIKYWTKWLVTLTPTEILMETNKQPPDWCGWSDTGGGSFRRSEENIHGDDYEDDNMKVVKVTQEGVNWVTE
ncbi:hypothetical protein Sjap_017989 [Stephania japonica]|uniref:Uncharacterized protein n=1 Tax=Stephania japonica TaxID=461633 RepID=A0AAP0NKL6_9MAGN